ncbi:MAG: hypothetical protein U9R52_04405, partial [Candidatus Omnitrophota bacterium]|nr:hypothetical protein [Candidatus Omnitrophota bacterium]
IRGNNKYDRFLDRLQDCGFVRVSEAADLKENIIELMNSGRKPKKLDDNKKLLDAVRRII